MSGKHIRVRALRSGVGTPVVTVGIGLVAWVVIGLALVLLPHPQHTQLDGSTQAGSAPPGSRDDSSAPTPSPEDESFGQEGDSLAEAEASPSAHPRTEAEGSVAPVTQSDADEPTDSLDPSTDPETGTETGTEASVDDEEPTEPPWADAPGRAKGHDKRPPRGHDEE